MALQKINPLALLIVGTNGTGKTTDALEIARSVKRAVFFTAQFNPSKGSLQQWYKLGGVFYISPGNDIKENEKIIGDIAEKYNGITMIIDDARLWIAGANRVGFFIARLFARRRHKKQNIVICVHSISQIPSEILDYQPIVRMKKTTGTGGDRATMPEIIYTIADLVNSQAFNQFDGYNIVL